VRFRAVDPGPVILHCHIDAHLATGMVIGMFTLFLWLFRLILIPLYSVLLEGPEKIGSGFVPQYYLNQNKP
jgi:hypothetical protein